MSDADIGVILSDLRSKNKSLLLGQLPISVAQQLRTVNRLVVRLPIVSRTSSTMSADTVSIPNECKAPKSEFLRQETLHREKWLSMERIFYRDPKGKERTWEMVERTTKPQRPGVGDAVAMATVVKRLLHFDCIVLVRQFRPPIRAYTIEFPAAVGMVTILKRLLHYDCLVLARQYRPPIRACTIEFPSGLIDSEETPAEAAVRELKEETGYVGTIRDVSPATVMDSGLSNATLHLVSVQVDGDDPVNQKPVQNLDEGESIQVILAPLHELQQKLQEFAEAGDLVDSRVYMYAATMAQFLHPDGDSNQEQQKGLYRK